MGTSAAMTVPTLRSLGLISAVAAGLALGIAWISQHWLDQAPCVLCLLERWPYRAMVVLGLLAAVVPAPLARALLWLAALAALVGAAIAFVHVGVEQHAWPSPLPECAAPAFRGGSIADMLKALPTRPAKPCDAPNYLIPGLPLSIAAMDLLYALACALALGGTLWRIRRRTT